LKLKLFGDSHVVSDFVDRPDLRPFEEEDTLLRLIFTIDSSLFSFMPLIPATSPSVLVFEN